MNERKDVINYFVQKNNYNSYLEIGLYGAPRTFNNIGCEIKNSVDAVNLATRTARKVLDAADAGISTATAIVDEGAYLLAQTAVAAWYGCGGKKADAPEIVIQGGPARNTTYSTKIALEINAKLPHAVVVESSGDNLDGATWIAQNMRQDAPPLLLWAAL